MAKGLVIITCHEGAHNVLPVPSVDILPMVRAFPSLSEAVGYAVPMAITLDRCLVDRTGHLSDDDCGRLVAEMRALGLRKLCGLSEVQSELI